MNGPCLEIILHSNTINNFSSIQKEGFECDLNAVYHSKFPELFLGRVFFIQVRMRYYVELDIL